jgi:hypothetical protein
MQANLAKTKPNRETVNSWVWTGKAPGIHLPKLSLGPIFIDDDLAAKLQQSGVIRVPADVDSIELAVIYWRHAAGAVHTIDVNEGEHAVDGEYLRLGHAYPLTLRGAGANLTTLNGGVRCTSETTSCIKLIGLTLSNQKAASRRIPRHGLLVDSGAQCLAEQCAFVECGGSGACADGKGSNILLVDCVANGNLNNGIFAKNQGKITLENSFEAERNGETIRGYQIEAKCVGSAVMGLPGLVRSSVVPNTIVEFDRTLGRDKTWVMGSLKETIGGKIERL